MIINSSSNFKESPIPTLPGTGQLKAESSFSEGRGAGLGWQGLFGGLRRKEQQRRCCDFFQQFLGLSRRSQPLPPRLHLPCCGGGQVFTATRLVGFFCCDLKDTFPESPYRGPRLHDPLCAWPWEAHITVGVCSAEGGMADLDRSQATGGWEGEWLQTPFSEQGPETRTLPTPQPPRLPTYTARGDVCPPFASKAVSQTGFAFLTLFRTAVLWT